MAKPEIAAKSPFAVNVEQGKDYWWCSCGKSKSQPFCDGSHKGSEFNPVKYTAAESKAGYFCGTDDLIITRFSFVQVQFYPLEHVIYRRIDAAGRADGVDIAVFQPDIFFLVFCAVAGGRVF